MNRQSEFSLTISRERVERRQNPGVLTPRSSIQIMTSMSRKLEDNVLTVKLCRVS
jgi:hypothetical protein